MQNSLKLILSNTLAHRTRRAYTTLYHLQKLIDVIRARPLLMLDHIHTAFHLWLLHQLAVSAHALSAVGVRELVGNQSGGV